MTAIVFGGFFKRSFWMLTMTAAATARAATARVFAAPETAGSGATGTAGHMVQTTLALLFVLALVFALAWFSRRVRAAANPGMARIEVLAQAALGTKERAVLVQVGSVQLLLGVAPGSVRALYRLTESEAFPTAANAATHAAAQPTNFSDLLRRSLDRS